MPEYFLHVDLLIDTEKADAFELATKAFLKAGGFQRLNPRFDNQLVLALKTIHPQKYTGHQRFASEDRTYQNRSLKASEEVHRYVHLWRMNSLDDLDLAQVMTSSADDSLYVAVDSLVLSSVQDLVLRVQWLGRSPVLTDAMRFVRVRRQFSSRNLGTYLFNVGALLPSFEKNDWHTLGHYQNVTGPLNFVTELWQTKYGGLDVKTMTPAFAAFQGELKERLQLSFLSLHYEETRELFARAPYFD